MKAGDIVFVRGKSWLSPLIRYFDGGEFTHVALAIDDTHVIEAERFAKVSINHANYQDYVVVDLGLNQGERMAAVAKAKSFIGKRYDYKLIAWYLFQVGMPWDSPNQLICSELVSFALERPDLKHIGVNRLYNRLKGGVRRDGKPYGYLETNYPTRH